MLDLFAIAFANDAARCDGTGLQRHQCGPEADDAEEHDHQDEADEDGGAGALIGREVVGRVVG